MKTLKFKQCASIAHGIMFVFFLPSEDILSPALLNIAKTIGAFLRTDLFSSHMTHETYCSLLDFVVSATKKVLHSDNESLVNQLFSCLLLLVRGKSRTVYAPLLEKYECLHILNETTSVFTKHESAALVTTFEIINHLIGVFYTENMKFAHDLVLVGLNLMLRFSGTTVEPLLIEFGLFLNTAAVHRLLKHDDMYNISTLLARIFPKLKLSMEDVGITFNMEESVYRHERMYLKSDNRAKWLLVTGTTKLAKTLSRFQPETQGEPLLKKQRTSDVWQTIDDERPESLFWLLFMPHCPDSQVLLRHIQSGSTQAKFWALHACVSKGVKDAAAPQVLKATLPLITDVSLCDVACSLIVSLKCDDSSVLPSIKGIAEQLDFNGPAKLSEQAIIFWWDIASRLSSSSSLRHFTNLKLWLYHRRPTPPFSSGFCKTFSKFLSWLEGEAHGEWELASQRAPVGPKPFPDNELSKFISLEKSQPNLINVSAHLVDLLSFASKIVSEFIARFPYPDELDAPSDLAHWTKLLVFFMEDRDCDQVRLRCGEFWEHIYSLETDAVHVVVDVLSTEAEDWPKYKVDVSRFKPHFEGKSAYPPSRSLSTDEFPEETKSLVTTKTLILPLFKLALCAGTPSEVLKIARIEEISSCICAWHLDLVKSETALSLVRLLGDGPLSSPALDRTDECVNALCDVIQASSILTASNEALKRDCVDLVQYLIDCVQKELFLSIAAQIRVWETLLIAMGVDGLVIKRGPVLDTFFTGFSKASNYLKVSLTNSLKTLMRNLDPMDEIQVYSDLFMRFSNSSKSDENAALYCYFFGKLSQGSMQIRLSGLFNLTECSFFPRFEPYLMLIMDDIVRSSGTTHQALFAQYKEDLLKCWWRQRYDFGKFPYQLFGLTHHDFLKLYRTEIASVVLASKGGDFEILDKQLGASLKDLALASMHKSVAFAYTSEGARNEIMKRLATLIGSSFNDIMKNRLHSIIYEILMHIDVTNAELLRKATGNDAYFVGKSLDCALQTIVSPGSGCDLIKALLKKYTQRDFWNLQLVRFFITQIAAASSSSSNEQGLMVRRIKLVLALSRVAIESSLSELLSTIVLPLLKGEQAHEAENLIDLMPLESFLGFDRQVMILWLVKVVEVLMTTSNVYMKTFIEKIEPALNTNSCRPFLEMVTNESFRNDSILTFLDDPLGRLCFLENPKTCIALFAVVAWELLMKLPKPDHRIRSKLEKHTNDFKSENLKVWFCEYVSLCQIVKEKPCSFNSTDYDFVQENASLNVLFDEAEEHVKTSFRLKGAIELAKGALKGLTYHEDIYPYFDTEMFEWMHEATAVDLETLKLMDRVIFDEHNFSDHLNEVTHISTREKFGLWCASATHLLLETEISHGLRHIIGYLLLRFPDVAQSKLLSICSFCLLQNNANLIERVRALIHALCSVERTNFHKDTLGDIISKIRSGARKGLTSFCQIYDELDIEKASKLLQDTNNPKGALIIKEDFLSADDVRAHRESLRQLYEAIGDIDLVYGLPEEASLNYGLNFVEDFGKPLDRIRYDSGKLDASLTCQKPTSDAQLSKSMRQEGFVGLSKSEDQYEWLWRLNQWQLPIADVSELAVVYSFFKKSLEGYEQNAYIEALLKLYTFKERENWSDCVSAIVFANEVFTQSFTNTDEMITKALPLSRQASECAWRTMTQRSEQNTTSYAFTYQNYIASIIRNGRLARMSGEAQRSINATMLLAEAVKTIRIESPIEKENLRRLSIYESAKMLWDGGQTRIPISMLETISDHSIEFELDELNVPHTLIRATLVDWLANSREKKGSEILTEYVEPMLDDIEGEAHQPQVYRMLAEFCESQLKSTRLREKIISLQGRVDSKAAEVNDIKVHYGKNVVTLVEKKAAQKYYSRLKNQLRFERAELEAHIRMKHKFADYAARFYLKELLIGDREESKDRFFSLFLEFAHDDLLQANLMEGLELLSTSVAVSWATQLMGRLSHKNTVFQRLLRRLITKLCTEHPFQTQYLLISLINHRETVSKTGNEAMKARIEAAETIRNDLLAQIGSVTRDIELFSHEAVKLAAYDTGKSKLMHLDRSKIGSFWMSNIPRIPAPTSSSSACIQSIDPKVAIATSGISLPKIVVFTLDDGTRHKMLMKSGTDDLRQDATMEQVFEKVNHMLLRDDESRARSLKIRTYKAVPLGPTSGLLEFVVNSRAFMDIVKPYHEKQDKLKLDRARLMMKDAQLEEPRDRVDVYKRICDNIQPVMKQYFADSHVLPEVWFASRQAYTRSTATASILGYVLGLGDRHCNNILIDEISGEPVHIDLGVAFDQGRRLPIPETVPFRLTRDVVDGFGILGTNGPFSKLSEHTFRVLQEHKAHILAIIDVLRWDPLHLWVLSPIRREKIQDGIGFEPEPDASEATAALTSVEDKLNSGLSVEATVKELIREATSVENLALIYCGWCPFY